jgi:hypothetical protein
MLPRFDFINKTNGPTGMKWYLVFLLLSIAFFVVFICCSYELAMQHDRFLAFKRHRFTVLYCTVAFTVLSIFVAKHAKLDLGWSISMPVIGYLLAMTRLVARADSERSIRQILQQEPYYEAREWYEAFLVFSMVQVLGFVIAFYRRPGPARGPERDGQ